jgi:hypothetical protein
MWNFAFPGYIGLLWTRNQNRLFIAKPTEEAYIGWLSRCLFYHRTRPVVGSERTSDDVELFLVGSTAQWLPWGSSWPLISR